MVTGVLPCKFNVEWNIAKWPWPRIYDNQGGPVIVPI